MSYFYNILVKKSENGSPMLKEKGLNEIVGYQSVPITRTYVGLLCSWYLDYLKELCLVLVYSFRC